MKDIMTTEAQRLISLSLAKIATSRCLRGGISLHKNLLIATVLQKARYIFMEEAFHMVHGHYISQENSKFIQELRHEKRKENHLRQTVNDGGMNDSFLFNDSELNSSTSNVDSDEDVNILYESNFKKMENLKCDPKNDNKPKKDSSVHSSQDIVRKEVEIEFKTSEICNRKRSNTDFNIKEDPSLLPPRSKEMKKDCTKATFKKNEKFKTLNKQTKNNYINITNKLIVNSKSLSNNNLEMNFLHNDSITENHLRNNSSNIITTPLDTSCSTNTTNQPISPISSSIDRINSLVSIFNFGNLQRSVSVPNLYSSSSNHCSVDCLQRQIAMTV